MTRKIDNAGKAVELKRRFEYVETAIAHVTHEPRPLQVRLLVGNAVKSEGGSVARVADPEQSTIYNALGLSDVQLNDIGRKALLTKLEERLSEVQKELVDLGFMNAQGEWL